MTPLFKYYKWRPTNDQELLLKAALFKGQAAKDAWQKWESKNKIEQIDYGSYRLIPLLHHNLKVEGIDHAYKEKFKKIHIKSWANNRMLFEKLSPLLSIFHENDIQTIILKGAPLIVRYYKDIGLRPMSDLDILIPTHEAHKAIHLLQKLGWVAALNPLEKSLDSYILLRHALEFKNLAKFEMDLHWHLSMTYLVSVSILQIIYSIYASMVHFPIKYHQFGGLRTLSWSCGVVKRLNGIGF